LLSNKVILVLIQYGFTAVRVANIFRQVDVASLSVWGPGS